MEIVEYELLLSDVETRLDRLKALYEQWFQGMERLEPTIARKETDRRMVLLRKELPRNTALRFRFQTLVQRYTTLQSYWGRVARQIEEGTYRRDLLKARKALLASKDARKGPTDHSFEIELDPDEDDFEAPEAALPPPVQRPAATLPQPSGAPLASRPSLSPIAPPPAVAAGTAVPRIVSPFARAAPRPTIAPAPGAPSGATVPPSAAQSPLPPPAIATFARPTIAPAPTTTGAQGPATATFARPGGAPSAPRPTAPAPPMPAAPGPRPAPAVFTPATSTPGIPVQRPAPIVPTSASPIARLTPATLATRPPPTAPVPAAPAPRPAPAAPARSAESLTDQDVRRVYDRYAEARRKNNEPDVSYDALAKNLRDAAPKMREKYGKPVDFEVVLKDGKVGLKPVPRG